MCAYNNNGIYNVVVRHEKNHTDYNFTIRNDMSETTEIARLATIQREVAHCFGLL